MPMRLARALTAAVLLSVVGIVLTACAKGPSAADLNAFAAATRATGEQTTYALSAVNARARAAQLERAAVQPTLSEASFVTPIDSADIERWRAAFGAIDAYAQAVAALAHPGGDADRDRIRALGVSIRSTAPTDMPPGIAAAAAEVGAALISARAGAAAGRVAASADPAITETLTAMAAAIGGSPDEALRATVARSFAPELADLSVAFLDAGDSPRARAGIARNYALALDRRDDADRALAAARAALLDLALAHSAIALRAPDSTAASIDRVNTRLERARAALDRIGRRPLNP